MNKKDKEEFEKWFKKNFYEFSEYEKNNQEIGWQAACEYKKKEIDELNQKLLNVWREAEEFYLED